MKPIIQFTVENKNDVYECSNSVEVNRTLSIVRIIRPIENGSNNSLFEILKEISINGSPVAEIYSLRFSKVPPSMMDLVANNFLKSTDDIVFKLAKNSKIDVTLFFK